MKPSRRGGAIAAAIAVVLVAVVAMTLGMRQRSLDELGTTPAAATVNNAACQGRLTWATGEADMSLLAVAASGPRDAWAVGTRRGRAAIMHWDGGGWGDATLPSVVLGTTSSALLAVAVVDAGDVWAVGRAGLRPLILHWNGAAWAAVEAAPVEAYSSQFSTLAVVAPGDVWAVGSALPTQQGTPHTIAEHWDGHSWQIAPAPQGKTVTSLAAAPGGAAWGLVTMADNSQQLVRWDGQAWQHVPDPDPGAERLSLRAVAAGPDGVLWAAGVYRPQGENWGQPIAERWDGHAWTRYPGALESRGAWYVSLAVGKDGTAWAAGTFTNFNTRLDNVFLQHLGGRSTDPGMSIYPGRYTDSHRDDSFNVAQIAVAPGADTAWIVGSTGSAPDPSLPPIDTNLPKASGAFVLRSC